MQQVNINDYWLKPPERIATTTTSSTYFYNEYMYTGLDYVRRILQLRLTL